MRVVTHVGPTDYQKYGADWSEDPEAVFFDFDAFQEMTISTGGADVTQVMKGVGLDSRIGAAFYPPHFMPPARITQAQVDPGLDAGVYTFNVTLKLPR